MKKKPQAETQGKTAKQGKGLSFSEKKRLMELKRTLSGNSKKQEKPTTAQNTITFKKMFQDGICQVTSTFYTKMVEFFDINYDLLEIEDQGEILEEYSKLINYFDPSIKFELFLFNRQVNEQTLIDQFDIPLQGDDFDDIREEYTEMLKKQAAKGNNGIIKSKYLIFGMECKGFKEARAKLASIEADVIKNFLNLGTHARSLDGKERLRILHEYFNQDTMEPFRFSFKELSESGKSVKDYIAPPGFDFRYPSRFKAGKMYGSVHYLDIIAPRFNDELLKKLLDIDDNLTITMHMQTFDPVKAIKMLKGALTNIQKMKIEEQKKAVRSGYDMDILPTDIITYEKDTLELLDDLNTSNQKIIKMTFLITCYGRSKRELENITQRVSGIIQQANCNLRCLQYLQEQGLMASAPIGCNETGIERVLTTKSTAILVPFCTQELFMPAPAIYYGLNALSNNMIMADRKRLRTPNGVILGTPGSGKSFSAKREILSCFLMTRDDVIICDPEGEYFALVGALHGQVVRLATNSKDFLNPMDIQLSHKGDKEALKLKSDFIITLCDLIAGGKDGLENDEKGIIDECIRHIYDAYFENPVPENMPILEDLYNALLKHKNKKAERIANSLVLYVHGSQNYFNHRTNVDSQNRIMCFDIRDLGKGLGTPATRADIIEKLVKDGFVKREKKQMLPTEDGMKLITVLPDAVKSPKLTADWENALTLVAKGEYSMQEFIGGIEEMVRELVQTYHSVSDEQKSMFGGSSQEIFGKCPKCGGDVVKGKFGAYCKNKCGMNVARAMGAMLSDSQIISMLEGKKTLVKGLKGKKGSYDAYLIPEGIEDYSYTKDGKEIKGSQYKVKQEFLKKKK